jgi:hypothetical protein
MADAFKLGDLVRPLTDRAYHYSEGTVGRITKDGRTLGVGNRWWVEFRNGARDWFTNATLMPTSAVDLLAEVIRNG